MRIKSIVAAAGIFLLATVSAAQAAERFYTIEAVPATEMSGPEMSQVVGAGPATEARLIGIIAGVSGSLPKDFGGDAPFVVPLTLAAILVALTPSP